MAKVKEYKASVEIFRKFSQSVPHFTDVFDEESFYIFVAVFVISTILIAFLLSRKITIKEHDI